MCLQCLLVAGSPHHHANGGAAVGSLSVCHAESGRLPQLHIIRRPWMEDSKVLTMAGRTLMVTEGCPSWHFPHSVILLPLPSSAEVQAPSPPPPASRHPKSETRSPRTLSSRDSLGLLAVPDHAFPVPMTPAHRLWAHSSVFLGHTPPYLCHWPLMIRAICAHIPCLFTILYTAQWQGLLFL